MAFNKSLFLIVSISSLLISTRALPSPPKFEVVEFCSVTDNPKLCVDTIAPYFQGSFEPLKALVAEFEATLNRSLKVANIIAESLNNPSTDKNALDALNICKSQYQSIVDAIKEAVKLLNQQNMVDANYKFNAVLSYRSACEDAFVESPGVDVPFADDSRAVFDLGGNCLAIMKVLSDNHIKF